MPSEFRASTSSLDFVRACVSAGARVSLGLCQLAAFNRVGTLLLSGSDDFRWCLWDWAKSQPVLTFDSGHKGNSFRPSLCVHGRHASVTCARDGQCDCAISASGAHWELRSSQAWPIRVISCAWDGLADFFCRGWGCCGYEIDLRQDMAGQVMIIDILNKKMTKIVWNRSLRQKSCHKFWQEKFQVSLSKNRICMRLDGLLEWWDNFYQ